MLNNRLPFRTAGKSSQGGFTLVELLVVIGIIAILAGVSLGPITRGIRQAKQSAGLQTARTIALSEFTFSNDNGAYPDTKNPTANAGAGAAAVAQPLLQGGYISDPTIFYTSGGQAVKYAGTTAGTNIAATNISWDFAGLQSGSGVNSNCPDQMPVVWSSVANGGMEPDIASPNVAVTTTPGTANPYGTAGVAVCFKSNSAKFVVSTGTGTLVSQLADASYPGYTGAVVLQGGG